MYANGTARSRTHQLNSDSSNPVHYELNQDEFDRFGIDSPHQTWETSFSNERLVGDSSVGVEGGELILSYIVT